MKTATEKRIDFRNNLKSHKIMVTPGWGMPWQPGLPSLPV